MIPRALAAPIRRALLTFPAVLVTGARQTGKTTLLRHEFASTHRYVSLEDPDVRSRVRADPVGFLRENPAPVILDEIQYTPDLLSYVKSRIDEAREPGQWILSGSQSFALMAGVSQSLTGRVAVLSLLPLSVGEALGRPTGDVDSLLGAIFAPAAPHSGGEPALLSPSPSLADWLLRGGYPEPRANPAVDRRLWCASYVQTYLERDVRRSLANIGDLSQFEVFLRLCAARTGQLLNVSELGRDAGVSQPTARRWLSVLEASMQVTLVRPWHRNIGKRLVKSPKLYFLDPAIATFLAGVHDAEATVHGPMAGPLLETLVVTEWIKAFHHRGEPPSLQFFRSHDGTEVDIVIERNTQLFAAEVKSASTVTPEHARGLARFRECVGAGGGPMSVLFANVSQARGVAPGIVARPWFSI